MGKYLLILFVFFLSGCYATRSDLTAVSSKNVNMSGFKLDRSKSKGRVSGKDCQQIIFVFPTGGPPSLDEAIDRALEPENANLLIDAVAKFNTFYIPYLFGETCWQAEGEAYDTYE